MIAALLVPPVLLAQTVSFGVRAGVPIADIFSVDQSRETSTQRYTFGPIIEIELWRGGVIGADFLFQSAVLGTGPSTTIVRRWELPLTFAYRLRPSSPRPFIRAGISLNRVFDTGAAIECARGPFGEQFYCLDGSLLAELRHRSAYGPVIGGGLQSQFGRIRFEVEARLTRWVDRNFGVRGSAVRSNLIQIEILAGATF